MLDNKELCPSHRNSPYGDLIGRLHAVYPDGKEVRTGYSVGQWSALLADEKFCNALLSTLFQQEVFIAKPADSDEICLNLGLDDMCGPRRLTDIELGHTHTLQFDSYVQGLGRGGFTTSSDDYGVPNTYKGDPKRWLNNQRVIISPYGRFYHSRCTNEHGIELLKKAVPHDTYQGIPVSFDAVLRSIAPYDFHHYKEFIETLLGCSVRFMPNLKFAEWMAKHEKKGALFDIFAQYGFNIEDRYMDGGSGIQRLIELIRNAPAYDAK